MAPQIVYLVGPENYTSWLRSLKRNASAKGVWDLISGEEEIKVTPKRPDKLGVDAKKKRLDTEPTDEDDREVLKVTMEFHTLSLKIHKLDLAEYKYQQERVIVANTFITVSVHDAILDLISDISNPHTTYISIQEACKPTKACALKDAKRCLEELKLSDCDGVSNFVYKAKIQQLDIANLGGTYTDSELVLKLMSSLGHGYERLVQDWELELANPQTSAHTIKAIHARLLAEENRVERPKGGR